MHKVPFRSEGGRTNVEEESNHDLYRIDDPDSCRTILSARHNTEPIGDERWEGSEEETTQMPQFLITDFAFALLNAKNMILLHVWRKQI